MLDAGRPTAERGRFDIISAWPEQLVQPEASESGAAFLQRLRVLLGGLAPARLPAELDLPFTGGLIGYLSYDFARRLEHLPDSAADDLNLPDARFGLYRWALISDHLLHTSQLVFHPVVDESTRH